MEYLGGQLLAEPATKLVGIISDPIAEAASSDRGLSVPAPARVALFTWNEGPVREGQGQEPGVLISFSDGRVGLGWLLRWPLLRFCFLALTQNPYLAGLGGDVRELNCRRSPDTCSRGHSRRLRS